MDLPPVTKPVAGRGARMRHSFWVLLVAPVTTGERTDIRPHPPYLSPKTIKRIGKCEQNLGEVSTGTLESIAHGILRPAERGYAARDAVSGMLLLLMTLLVPPLRELLCSSLAGIGSGKRMHHWTGPDLS